MIILIGIFTFYVHCAVSLKFCVSKLLQFYAGYVDFKYTSSKSGDSSKGTFSSHCGFVDHIASGMWTTLLVG